MSSISAIIPTFNRKAFLVEALDAILRQTRPVDQIIVWDDGSSDGTEAALDGIRDPRLLYRKAPNAGKASALNRAMALATGDYVWICDDDDLPTPDAAELLAGALDADPEIGLAGGCYQRFRDGPGAREVTGPGYWPDLTRGTPLRHLLEDIFLFQNATLVRRSCYDKVGGFREDLPRSIDYDMIVRLATRFPIRMLEATVFLQRKHDGMRGPMDHRHSADNVDHVWAEKDAEVFRGLRSQLPLSLFEAMFAGDDGMVRRAARLQRGDVFARHGLWSEALDDFEGAANLMPDRPLTPEEFEICRRAVSGKHGAFPPEPEVRRLVALRRSCPAGHEIVGGLGRGLLWSLRRAAEKREFSELARLAGLLTATRLHLKPSGAEGQLREVSALPADAYDW